MGKKPVRKKKKKFLEGFLNFGIGIFLKKGLKKAQAIKKNTKFRDWKKC